MNNKHLAVLLSILNLSMITYCHKYTFINRTNSNVSFKIPLKSCLGQKEIEGHAQPRTTTTVEPSPLHKSCCHKMINLKIGRKEEYLIVKNKNSNAEFAYVPGKKDVKNIAAPKKSFNSEGCKDTTYLLEQTPPTRRNVNNKWITFNYELIID